MKQEEAVPRGDTDVRRLVTLMDPFGKNQTFPQFESGDFSCDV